MDVYEIRPRPTRDGFDLCGEMLGGTDNRHWFRTVKHSAEYARDRARQSRDGGILRVYHADGTLRAERVLPGGGGCLGLGMFDDRALSDAD